MGVASPEHLITDIAMLQSMPVNPLESLKRGPCFWNSHHIWSRTTMLLCPDKLNDCILIGLMEECALYKAVFSNDNTAALMSRVTCQDPYH